MREFPDVDKGLFAASLILLAYVLTSDGTHLIGPAEEKSQKENLSRKLEKLQMEAAELDRQKTLAEISDAKEKCRKNAERDRVRRAEAIKLAAQMDAQTCSNTPLARIQEEERERRIRKEQATNSFLEIMGGGVESGRVRRAAQTCSNTPLARTQEEERERIRKEQATNSFLEIMGRGVCPKPESGTYRNPQSSSPFAAER